MFWLLSEMFCGIGCVICCIGGGIGEGWERKVLLHVELHGFISHDYPKDLLHFNITI